MDTILIFVRRIRTHPIVRLIQACQSGLFAAFLSAFLIETLSRLEEDPAETTRDVLIHQTRMMRNTTLGPFEPQAFQPSDSVVVVNVLLFASLAIILMAAFMSILVKGWIRELDRGLKSISVMKDRAIVREYRTQGFERYKLPQIIALLPLLIYNSLFLFSCGLTVFLFSIHRSSALAIAVVMGVGVVFYSITLSLSIVDGSAPFKSPISQLGSSIFRRLYPLLSTHHWYSQWIQFSLRFYLPHRVFAFIGKVLLWKPHTDHDLAAFDHSDTLSFDCYHVARLSQEVETTVLNTVHILPRATASRVRDVQQSLVTAGGELMHQVLLDVPDTILEPFMGCDISLDQARTIATLIACQKMVPWSRSHGLVEIEGKVISLLKSSSDYWDNLLAILMSIQTAGQDTASDLVGLTLSAPWNPQSLTLSQISMTLNSIRVLLTPWENRQRLVASVRIGDVILRCQKLSIIELAFIIAHFIAWTQPPPVIGTDILQGLDLPYTELRDGKIFYPYLYDDSVLLDLIDLFNSFPSLIPNLARLSAHPKACGAFAIHFLIRLHQASPVTYWRIMRQLSYKEVREWAREVSKGLMDEAAHVILNSQGIPGGPSGILSNVQIQHYDQSLDPRAVDLDMPMVHAIYSAAEWQWDRERPIATLANVWLAIHAQTATVRQQLPIPVEHIQWVDHPIADMIALYHLSSYHFIEIGFIHLFLHSTSFEVLLLALKHLLEWLHGLSGDGHVPDIPLNRMSWNEILNVLSNALKVLLRSDLAPNQLSSFWRLVNPLCDTQWAELPDSWRLTFLQCFFSLTDRCPDMLATASASPVSAVSWWDGVGRSTDPLLLPSETLSLNPEYLGIKWLETVWEKVLKLRSRTVVIGPVPFPWLGVEGGEWDHSDEKVLFQKAEEQEVGEQELDQSVTNVLQILAKLLEVARLHGLVTVGLAGSISRSLLLADAKLQQDQISLDCIKYIICPLLVPLPSTPPPQVIRFSCHLELP
jgi:hypothetical protein